MSHIDLTVSLFSFIYVTNEMYMMKDCTKRQMRILGVFICHEFYILNVEIKLGFSLLEIYILALVILHIFN